eukprot:6208010-Pleurochrysis_carterae.AAC.1
METITLDTGEHVQTSRVTLLPGFVTRGAHIQIVSSLLSLRVRPRNFDVFEGDEDPVSRFLNSPRAFRAA